MNLLAFCCALDKTYLAIKFDEKIISEVIESDENYHSLYLISKIKTIFEENSFDLKYIDAIVVNCGPGSFTGIRVALSVAKVIAGELNKPLIPLNAAEILLQAYNSDKLIMDARRDMFFVGDKTKIELVLKEKINEKISMSDRILVDRNSSKIFSNAFCYEDGDKNIALSMLELGNKKFESTKDKNEFNYLNVQPNYIQTPPVF